MKGTTSDNASTPEEVEGLKEAFELGMLFAEKSPKDFMEILKRRQKEKGLSPIGNFVKQRKRLISDRRCFRKIGMTEESDIHF